LRYNPEHKAGRGRHGEGSRKSGKAGEDTIVKVPVGTTVYDSETDQLLFDFTEDGQRFLVAQGGRGGFGNTHFKSSTNQAPRYHQEGGIGDYAELQLELKLLADVGLVGFPNAGKSTLISVISAAKPKIADYPFTTLEPNLGVVSIGEYKTVVVADIPGLIEGASEGAGLGHTFLRHVERTKLLLHLVDVSPVSGRDPIEDYEAINRELKNYDEELAKRPQIIVATKMDILEDVERVESLKKKAAEDGHEFFEISAAAQTGTHELVMTMATRLDEIAERARELKEEEDDDDTD
jgi:GTP-binding protein